MTPALIGQRNGGGGIDLSVVLGDQLIPIVCASTDRNQCLIAYGLFLHGEDKDPPSHSTAKFESSAEIQLRSD